MSNPQEIHKDAINLSPAVMVRASIAQATDEVPTHGAQIINTTGMSQPQISKILATMRAKGEAEHVGIAGLTESHRIVDLVAGTEQLREQLTTDVHLARATGLLSFAERRNVSSGAAFDELLNVGHMILEASNPGLGPTAPQAVREDAINLSPAVMVRANVTRATNAAPTHGVRLGDETGLSEAQVSRVLADMKANGDAAHGERLAKSDSGRAVVPIVSTEQLRGQVDEDVHLQRAVGVLNFAERKGVSPGEAVNELIRIGDTILEASNAGAQTPVLVGQP